MAEIHSTTPAHRCTPKEYKWTLKFQRKHVDRWRYTGDKNHLKDSMRNNYALLLEGTSELRGQYFEGPFLPLQVTMVYETVNADVWYAHSGSSRGPRLSRKEVQDRALLVGLTENLWRCIYLHYCSMRKKTDPINDRAMIKMSRQLVSSSSTLFARKGMNRDCGSSTQ